jgi:prevent-host-death family protein
VLNEAWKLQDAKARSGRPQRISRRGKDAVILVRIEEYEAATEPEESLAAFFARSPHRDVELHLERSEDTSRDIVL